jgi:hypothetical protein
MHGDQINTMIAHPRGRFKPALNRAAVRRFLPASWIVWPSLIRLILGRVGRPAIQSLMSLQWTLNCLQPSSLGTS